MSLIQKGLQFLINSFQSTNPRLFQVLNGLNDQTVSIIDQINSDEFITYSWEYRFELPDVQAVANDVYPVWKQIRCPLDANNNVIGNGQRITRLDINAKVAPVGSNYIVDILVTKDKGVTFNSILPPSIAQKIVLPIGLHWIKFGSEYFAANILQDGWWFKINVLQADGTVAKVELVLRTILVF